MDIEVVVEEIEDDKKNTSSDSKESEGENVDAIKKFIEDQEKEIQEQDVVSDKIDDKNNVNADDVIGGPGEPLAVATSVMEMILSESEAKISNKDVKAVNQTLSPALDRGNSSMALSVGSKVEAKDFAEVWYPAEITEVDYDEMEVLVHYEVDLKKHDEWISVSSPRLRPIGSGPTKTKPLDEITIEPLPIKEELKEPKIEEKPKLAFDIGERCLARWRDNRRFVATINKELENGNFEIIFDDGFHWTCNVTRLSKLKERLNESLTIDTSSKSPSTSTLSPVYGAGPSNATAPTNASTPAYHTHLFDPTRDYLGSKSERREMKRKLNIKEIFNIGQKRPKILKPKEVKPVVKKPPVKKEVKPKLEIVEPIKKELKVEIPYAVASIIGSVSKRDSVDVELSSVREEDDTEENKQKDEVEEVNMEVNNDDDPPNNADAADTSESYDCKADEDPVLEEEVKLEKFDKQDEGNHEEVIDRIRDVISKLEDGIIKDEREKLNSPKPEIKIEVPVEAEVKVPSETPAIINDNDKEPNDKVEIEAEKPKKPMSKIKKGKKLRLLQEKKVKKQVEKVKNELEEMKKQVEEMRQQMLMKTQELSKASQSQVMPESFLLPGEWCAKWLNGQPVGTVSEIESEVRSDGQNKPALPRRSVQVEDKRLPEGWTKHMVRRSFGHSAGKWDVVLVSPDNRRFHTKNEMKNYLENNLDVVEELAPFQHAIMDFGVHLKLSRRMGWISTTPGGVPEAPLSPLPAGTLSSTSPLVKRKKLSLNKKVIKVKDKKRRLAIKLKLPRRLPTFENTEVLPTLDPPLDQPTLEDGYVYVGSLKVQIIENLLRCPAEGCLKNFRNNTLLQMHIKHYHRELRKMLGATPKVLDLAYARTMPVTTEERKPQADSKVIKVKISRPKRDEPKAEPKELQSELQIDVVAPSTPVKDPDNIPKALDSPKLRHALVNKPVKRPRVLLPVRRPEPEQIPTDFNEDVFEDSELEVAVDVPVLEVLDFETAISTHTVTKPLFDKKRKGEKKMPFASVPKKEFSEDDEWYGINSDVDTRSSFPRSGTPDSKIMDGKPLPVSSESNEDQKDPSNMYMFTENGERIKIVHMKREEIINCHCGFREEDGLMVQCELCLCWQHALCHNIQKESEVPDKYTCSICLNPWRGRASMRYVHDQDRVYEGLLPAAPAPSAALRRAHELSGNLVRIEDALHALRIKYHVATKKDHPKLYLWAQDWEAGELTYTQEKLNSDYSDLNIMISAIGKENLPIKPEDMKDLQLNMTPPSEEQDGDSRFSQRDGLGSQALLSGLLSSPGGASLELPISTSELERLARSVQEREFVRVSAPQPEAAIENSVCREHLLRHISRCHARLDARLDSIEAQVAELESQDPSFEDDETADYFPRTKQTIQMLMRDLDTMEELGVIT